MISLPWLRRFNYHSDYFHYVYELYATEYPAYPITYYSMDYDNSILEDQYLDGGTYEKNGLGPLSGKKWKKIMMFPVHNIEQIQPSFDPSEKGLILRDSETSSFTFPDVYGMKPVEGDFIIFDQGFMQQDINIKPMFVVSGLSLAHYGDYLNIYKCTVRVVGDFRSTIEQQISSYHMFLEFDKKIHRVDNAHILLEMERKNFNLSEKLRGLFHNPTGFYLQKEELC